MESLASAKAVPKGGQRKTRNLRAAVYHWGRESELVYVVRVT